MYSCVCMRTERMRLNIAKYQSAVATSDHKGGKAKEPVEFGAKLDLSIDEKGYSQLKWNGNSVLKNIVMD